ncbi:MAG: shikimate kinase [Saprospiraceae bacterium]|nr:shikimate kinase [Saprospiraceae bacterium]
MVNKKQESNFPGIIILVGFMGSGKTTVGRALAEALSYQMVDTDAAIENSMGISVAEIFSNYGEDHFRRLEQDYIREMKTLDKVIICTGGGMPVFNDNMKALIATGTVVYLKTGVETILKRVGTGLTRPLLSKMNIAKKRKFVSQKLREREEFYSKAHFKVMAGKSVDAVVRNIVNKLSKVDVGD